MSDATQVDPAAPPPVDNSVAIENAATRMKMFPLAWPVTYHNTRYDQIGLCRMTAKQVADFVVQLGAVGAADPNAILRFPIFVDATGAPLPDALLDGLDADDADMLNEAAVDFLPRRFRVNPEPATAPSSGGTTAAS
jgi:hypothetical protein